MEPSLSKLQFCSEYSRPGIAYNPGVRRAGLFFLLAVLVWVGCNGDDDDVASTATPTPSPLFETHVVPILYSQCGADSAACHSRVTFVADSSAGCVGFLALENSSLGSVVYSGSNQGLSTGCPDEPLYDRLMKLASQCTDGRAHIEPGQPLQSYLFNKIAGGPYCALPDGSPSGPMPFESPIDNPDDIDLIRDWIMSGAPRQN